MENRCNNYAGRYQSTVCKIRSSVSPNDALCQDCTIFGLYKEIDTLCHRINEGLQCKPFVRCSVFSQDLSSIDTFLAKVPLTKVFMINDDHAKMESRAFLLSLLPKFRKLGYTHLAMEAFSNLNEHIPSVNLGYYFQEPILAEIYREAKRLGFQFIVYEDTTNSSTNEGRDSLQALNLYNRIKRFTKDEKVIVFPGHMHIAEDVPSSIPFRPFATVFKSLSGIDPVTIDQTRNIPNNLKSCDFAFDVDSNASGVFPSDCLKEKMGFQMVDAFYIHPQTTYKYGRPTWLQCGKLRKHVAVRSRYLGATIVQVYYYEELGIDKDLEYVTPADMVPKADTSGILHFYLVPGHKYVVVYRDENNKIVGKHFI